MLSLGEPTFEVTHADGNCKTTLKAPTLADRDRWLNTLTQFALANKLRKNSSNYLLRLQPFSQPSPDNSILSRRSASVNQLYMNKGTSNSTNRASKSTNRSRNVSTNNSVSYNTYSDYRCADSPDVSYEENSPRKSLQIATGTGAAVQQTRQVQVQAIRRLFVTEHKRASSRSRPKNTKPTLTRSITE